MNISPYRSPNAHAPAPAPAPAVLPPAYTLAEPPAAPTLVGRIIDTQELEQAKVIVPIVIVVEGVAVGLLCAAARYIRSLGVPLRD